MRGMWKLGALCCCLASAALAADVSASPPPAAPSPEAIERSLESAFAYLSARQQADGSFPEQYGGSPAIPALVGMAYLSKGCLPNGGPYSRELRKCLDYVLSRVERRPDHLPGYLGGPHNGRMYAHAIATLFLCECSGMVDPERQSRIDAMLPRAVKIILDAQNHPKDDPSHEGGWRYTPTSRDSDLSCSGWALMALKSARLNGAQVPPAAIENAVKYIRRAYREKDGSFSYQGASGAHAETLTGAAVLCLELCGRHLDPASLKASQYLRKTYERTLGRTNGNVYYGLYYTSQGLFQIGGDVWRDFSAWMYATYLERQRGDGAWEGTGNENSTVYATAMAVLAFTVPYRMLPIYQRDETVE